MPWLVALSQIQCPNCLQVPNVEHFLSTYNMQCPMAAKRLIHSGIPATLEHGQARWESPAERLHSWACLDTHCFGAAGCPCCHPIRGCTFACSLYFVCHASVSWAASWSVTAGSAGVIRQAHAEALPSTWMLVCRSSQAANAARSIADTVQCFITAMDSLKLGMSAVDEVDT